MRIMKKALPVLLVLLMVFSMSASAFAGVNVEPDKIKVVFDIQSYYIPDASRPGYANVDESFAPFKIEVEVDAAGITYVDQAVDLAAEDEGIVLTWIGSAETSKILTAARIDGVNYDSMPNDYYYDLNWTPGESWYKGWDFMYNVDGYYPPEDYMNTYKVSGGQTIEVVYDLYTSRW